jgi:hypothetical protein
MKLIQFCQTVSGYKIICWSRNGLEKDDEDWSKLTIKQSVFGKGKNLKAIHL